MKQKSKLDACPYCADTDEFITSLQSNTYDIYCLEDSKLVYQDTYSELPDDNFELFCRSCGTKLDMKKYDIKFAWKYRRR